MNKNTLLAFVLIAFTVIFFNSSLWNNFWYGTILKKPVPTSQAKQQQRAADDDLDAARSGTKRDSADIRVIPPDSEIAQAGLSDTAADNNSADTAVDDDAAAAVMSPAVEDTIIVETDRIIAAISTRGARLVSVKMKDYAYVGPRQGELIDLLPAGSVGGAQLSVNNESFDEKIFTFVDGGDDGNNRNNGNDGDGGDAGSDGEDAVTAVGKRHFTVSAGADDTAAYRVVFETKSADGRPVRKTFSFANGTYKIGYAVGGDGIAGRKISLGWEGGIDDTEAGQGAAFGGGGLDRRRAHYSDGRAVHHFEMKKSGVEEPGGRYRWVGMSSKYFFVAVVAEEVFEADLWIKGRDISRKQSKDVDIDYSISYKFEAESNEIENWIYAGPGRIEELSRHGLKFEKSLFPVLSWARHIFWADAWFPPLAELILKALQFFYGLVKDYGIAIFLLTLLSKVITYPMTQSSAKSMMRMKDLQPKLVAIRQKHKSNPQKMNEEMMALYKAEGVNPLNPGCLPMFLQMPIFIALFVVLRKAIELRGATSFILPWVKDLALPEALFYLPGAGLPIYGNNVALMPIIMAALTFFQQKQVITDPNQKMMIYMMPILMLVMFNGFPAGVVFYWTVSSALGLVQQKWLKPKTPDKPAMATVTASGVTHSVPIKKGSGGKRKR